MQLRGRAAGGLTGSPLRMGRCVVVAVMTAGSSLAGGSSRLKGKGEVVSAGDQVVLVAHNNEVLVVRDEEGEAAELMTVPVDQALLSKATWEVRGGRHPPAPDWACGAAAERSRPLCVSVGRAVVRCAWPASRTTRRGGCLGPT